MPVVYLLFEFVLLFVVLPLLIYYRVLPNFPIPYLLLAAMGIYFLLRQDPTFPMASLFSWRGLLPQVFPLLVRDAFFLVLLGLVVRLVAPQLLFSLPRKAPLLWLAVMLLYPLVSVLPQELLYRAFFFHRYLPLFGSGWGMLLASASAFSFVHIIFRNFYAVALCLFGGLLFSLTYSHSHSLLLTCLDHAIFGDFLFTIGLGHFFYHGSLLPSPAASDSSPILPRHPLK